jgi:hypothetical protein
MDPAQQADGQSPTPSQGEEGTDLRTVARQVEGLLDDDGHYNPNPDQVSRGHPDYDESADDRANAPERDDRGRFKKAAADDDQGDVQPESDDDEQLDDDTRAAGDDQDEDTGDGDTDDDQAASAGDEAATDEGETDAIESLAEFAEALEVPLDELKESVTHTFNAAGEEVTVTLSELEAGYQKDADYRRNTAKLAQDRQDAEQGFYQRHQDYEQQNHFLAGTMQVAEQIVAAELNDPRLTELRESDPAEWTARRDEIGGRLQHLRNARIQAAQAYEQYTGTMKQQLRDREQAALVGKLPDFGKQHRETAKTVMSEMGFHPQEISEVFDHRLILGVLELADLRKEVAELRTLKEQAEDTTRRVKKDIPKLTKPGKQRRARPGLKKDNIAKLRQRAQKSGKVGDAAKVIEQLL